MTTVEKICFTIILLFYGVLIATAYLQEQKIDQLKAELAKARTEAIDSITAKGVIAQIASGAVDSISSPQRSAKMTTPQDSTVCGDVDGNGVISITDAVYLVRYIFAGGSAPCPQRFKSVTLTWTAVGDDSLTGTAAEYDIRYSTDSISIENWDQATECSGEPNPQVAGSIETFVVTGLLPNANYWFAIKVRDDDGNWSWISNVVWK